MKNTFRAAAVIFIGFVFTLSLLFFLLPDQTYSEKEKRNLAKLPELTLSTLADGSFMNSMEDYTADQFPDRNGWMRIKTFISRCLGENESQGVYLCDDDTLIERFDAPSDASVTETVNCVNDFCLRHPESSFYFLLVPTAVTIHPEKLPENAPTDSEAAYMQRFTGALSDVITEIDVSARFMALKDSTQLYYRTDHHWTGDAAHEAYLITREAMGLTSETTYTGHVVSNTFYGSLTSESGFSVRTPDSLSVWFPEPAEDGSEELYTVLYTEEARRTASCYETEKLLSDDPYQVFFGGNHPLIEIRTDAAGDRSLLVIKDSYANCFVPFLLSDYTSITVLDPRYYYDDIDILMTSGQYTDVLFLYNASTLAGDTSLSTVLRNEQ